MRDLKITFRHGIVLNETVHVEPVFEFWLVWLGNKYYIIRLSFDSLVNMTQSTYTNILKPSTLNGRFALISVKEQSAYSMPISLYFT